MHDAKEPSSFGALLRHHRLAAGLTQEQLAARCGLGTRSIQNLEGNANRPHRETLRLLANHLALAGEPRAHFEAAAQPIPRGPRGEPPRVAAGGRASSKDVVRLADRGRTDQELKLIPRDKRARHPADAPVLTVPNNLPIQWTSFVGREQATSDVLQLLESTPLLTLTGTGGCGKTRLAIEVAKRVSDSYPDGVWLIELAPLTDPTLIAHTIAFTIGAQEVPGEPILQTLIQHLRSKRIFLVFDNCEHVIEGSAQAVDAILRSCPQVGILATSREVLRITGEVSWRVPSMAVPAANPVLVVEDLVQNESARLFAERARAALPGFSVTSQNASAVARLRGLSVDQLAARLDQRFRLLTGGSRAAPPASRRWPPSWAGATTF